MVHRRLKPLLYLICILADFCGFVVVFAVSRNLAEQQESLWYLGLAGGAFAGSSGVANVLGGWVSHRFDSRIVFLFGALTVLLAVVACGTADTSTAWFLPRYCLLGVGLGSVYPTLIGWLNRDQDAHANRRGVSRTLIIFCVSWNFGMMAGQMTSGALFSKGPEWAYGVAFGAAVVMLALAILAAWLVTLSDRSQKAIRVDDASDPTQANVPELDRELLVRAAGFKRLSWIANLGGTFGGSLIFHLLPDLAVSIGVPADNHGGLLGYWRSIVIVMYLAMHVSTYWHYRFSTSIIAQALGVVGLLAIAWAESATLLFVGLTLQGLLSGYNYFSGLFYSTAGSSQERRTLAAGLHEATLAVGMSSGTILGGALGTWFGPRVPWFFAAAVLSGLIMIQLIIWSRWQRSLQEAASEQDVA